MRAARAIELDEMRLDLAHFGPRRLDLLLADDARFAHDELGLALRRLPDLLAQLLRAHQRVVERFVPIAKGAQLLVEPLGLGVQLDRLLREALELRGDLLPELLHALRIVAAERAPEIVAAHV